MFASFVLVIAIALQVLPSTTYQKQTPASNKNTIANQGPSPTSVPSTGIPSEVDQFPANEQKQATQNKSNTWPPMADPFWSNWALVIISAFAVRAALRTLGILREQTDIAKTAADAARLNAQIMINTERALVEVELAEPSHDIDERTGETSDVLRCGFKITNYGRTVAHIISFGIGTGCFPGYCRFRIEDFETSRSRTEHSLLAVGKSATLFDLDVGQLFTDWPSIQDETKTGMLRLEVRYEDIIKGERDKSSPESYETSAIFYYAPVFEELRRLPKYNVYT
jgi:hypothetical protein